MKTEEIRYYLYRRLSKFITCKFDLGNNRIIEIYNKYNQASFQDVFCDPFYSFALYQILDKPLKIVVDCGANCGHFSILTQNILSFQFKKCEPDYYLFEPNPYIIDQLRKNLFKFNLLNKCEIVEGVVGSVNHENASLYINPKNYLSASKHNFSSKDKAIEVKSINLDLYFENIPKIDLCKLDIEGSEYDLIEGNRAFLSKVKHLIVEFHEEGKNEDAFDLLKSYGFSPAFIRKNEANNTLALFAS